VAVSFKLAGLLLGAITLDGEQLSDPRHLLFGAARSLYGLPDVLDQALQSQSMRAVSFAAAGIGNLIESNHTASIADFSRCVKAPSAVPSLNGSSKGRPQPLLMSCFGTP